LYIVEVIRVSDCRLQKALGWPRDERHHPHGRQRPATSIASTLGLLSTGTGLRSYAGERRQPPCHLRVHGAL
jgi:hypothetical protein